MNRSLILAAGLAAFAALCWWCVRHHAVLIEADIFERSTVALAAADTPWALPLFADGQRVAIGGVAPNETERQRAEALVLGVTGVTAIDNQISVRATGAAATGPYSFVARYAEGEVELTGLVPDDGTRASVVGAARSAFKGQRVIDRLSVTAGAPDLWSDALKLGIARLALLQRGELEISGRHISLNGVAPSRAVRDQIGTGIDALGYEFDSWTTLGAATAEQVATCQAEFDRLLATRIRFSSGSASIATDSFPLLDELALAVKRCDSVSVEVQGHTDSRGADENNMHLSQRRAEAVVGYLVAEGVATDQLTARGYGEAQPIAINDTPDGRARNRRIEFKIVENQQ